jgi:hypothetical protein
VESNFACLLFYIKCFFQYFYYIAVSPLVALVQHIPGGPVIIGTTIELICTTAGKDPPRTITWTFNGAAIDTGSDTTTFNISRQISSSDYGMYTCSASNEIGSDNETIEIIQAGMYYYPHAS